MKTYCVHVYERPYQYENVKAKTPEEAERMIVNREWAGNYDNIQNVEVKIQCQECGTDNDTTDKKCEMCDLPL